MNEQIYTRGTTSLACQMKRSLKTQGLLKRKNDKANICNNKYLSFIIHDITTCPDVEDGFEDIAVSLQRSVMKSGPPVNVLLFGIRERRRATIFHKVDEETKGKKGPRKCGIMQCGSVLKRDELRKRKKRKTVHNSAHHIVNIVDDRWTKLK